MDGRQVHYVSPSVQTVYGREPQAFFDDPALWLSLCQPEDHSAVRKSMRDLLIDGRRSMRVRFPTHLNSGCARRT